MTFKQWWEQNKAVYELVNITEDIARTIWAAACDNLAVGFIEELHAIKRRL